MQKYDESLRKTDSSNSGLMQPVALPKSYNQSFTATVCSSAGTSKNAIDNGIHYGRARLVPPVVRETTATRGLADSSPALPSYADSMTCMAE